MRSLQEVYYLKKETYVTTVNVYFNLDEITPSVLATEIASCKLL